MQKYFFIDYLNLRRSLNVFALTGKQKSLFVIIMFHLLKVISNSLDF